VVRESFYVYAGICLKLGHISSLILLYANTEMMSLFLENVSNEFKEFEIIMQIDGAGWYKAKGLRVFGNIHFIQQLTYSHEVNPTRRLWDEIKIKNFDAANKIKHIVTNRLILFIHKFIYFNEFYG
jgi:hypothetical protein